MARSSCPSCRAANLPDALVCVTCGSTLRAGDKVGVAAQSAKPKDVGWTPLVPEESPRERLAAEGRAAARVIQYYATELPERGWSVADVDGESLLATKSGSGLSVVSRPAQDAENHSDTYLSLQITAPNCDRTTAC